MRIPAVGRLVFAATLIMIGIQGFARGDFGAIWQPVPKDAPARVALVYLCAVISLGGGVGLLKLSRHATVMAARVLLAWLLLWLVLFRLTVIARAPGAMDSWENSAESAVIAAGAWVLYAGLATASDRRYLAFATGDSGVRIARVIYGLAMIPFGIAHFAYMKMTASFVPAWIPAHLFWACATGAAYLAAGLAILTGVCARLAATLSTWQMGLFTALIWVPIVSGGNAGVFQWNETLISLALTAGGWLVAESYQGRGWLGFGRR
jgi:uncharacterized membrane protein